MMPQLEAITRRRALLGILGLVAAPAIVRAASIMPVRSLPAGWIEIGDADGGFILPGDFVASLRSMYDDMHANPSSALWGMSPKNVRTLRQMAGL